MTITKFNSEEITISECIGSDILDSLYENVIEVGYRGFKNYNLSDFTNKEKILILEEIERQLIENIEDKIIEIEEEIKALGGKINE